MLGALCFEPYAVTGPSEAAAMVDLLEPPAVTDPTEPTALRNAFVHSGQASGSSDGLHAGTAGRDLRMSSAKYQCVHCGVGFHRNDVYINLDELSMDGRA